jgi:hypothetical protein
VQNPREKEFTMSWRRWKLSALLAGAVVAGNAAAQAPAPIIHTSPPGCAVPSHPPISPVPSTTPGTSQPPRTTPTPETPATQPSTVDQAQAQAGEGASSDSFASGVSYSESLATPAGTGLASATTVQTGGGRGTSASGFTAVTAPAPLILPGLFTAINTESARPQNRVFMGYGYYDGFQTPNPTPGAGLIKGFNLNVFNVGAEVAFLDNRASAYVRVPWLVATDNVAGVPLDGLGDVSIGLKYALLSCNETGSALSVGLTVATPTARDLNVTTNRFRFDFDPTGTVRTSGGSTLPPNTTATVNPTYIQPWVAGLAVLDRLFVSSYAGLVLSTDDATSSFVNAEVGLGYQIYRCESRDSWVTSITPTFSAQALLPINHQGTPAGSPGFGAPLTTSPTGQLIGPLPQEGVSINSPYQVFLTEGVSIGLGCRSLLSVGVVTPVTGPKAYTVGAVVGFNFFF